jgi:hypothetical protein
VREGALSLHYLSKKQPGLEAVQDVQWHNWFWQLVPVSYGFGEKRALFVWQTISPKSLFNKMIYYL